MCDNFALFRILKAKKKTGAGFCVIKISAFNFKTKSYLDLIDWQNCELTEPRITTHSANEDIMQLIESGEYPVSALGSINFSCHTICVERDVNPTIEYIYIYISV